MTANFRENLMPTRIVMKCAHCGGENVMRDAWAVWDIELQAWVLGNVFDAGHCDACGGNSTLVEESIETPLPDNVNG
jgi:hypothetical protein